MGLELAATAERVALTAVGWAGLGCGTEEQERPLVFQCGQEKILVNIDPT